MIKALEMSSQGFTALNHDEMITIVGVATLNPVAATAGLGDISAGVTLIGNGMNK